MGAGLMAGARYVLIEMDVPPFPEFASHFFETTDVFKAELLVQLAAGFVAADHPADDGVIAKRCCALQNVGG